MAEESKLLISIDARNAEKTAKELDKELNNITNSGNKADKQTKLLGTSVRSLVGHMAALVTVSATVAKIDAYANLQNRLRLVTKSQEELNKATSDTFSIAQKTYQSWDSVVQVYQRFSDNAKTLGINMEQTARLTETVSKAVAISGASTQAAEAALTQFGQALASGVLRGEELNSVMEQTPALAKAIAQGMGITVGQLRAVAAEGQITSDVLVKALGKAAQDVDQNFSKMQMTIGQSLTVLDNQLTSFASNAQGAGGLIADSIKTVADNLELIVSGSIVAGIGYLAAAITTKTTAVYGNVTALIAQRNATALQAAEELRLAQANVAQTATEVANAEAKVVNNQATLALIATEKALEVERMKAQINQSGRVASATRMAEIRKVEALATRDLALAEAQLSAAKAKSAAASTAAATASTGALTAGRALLGVLGGPVGIGITVASLAAGYLLMRDNSAEATEELNRQAAVANKTAQELRNLEGAQKTQAKKDLAEAFKQQNEELARLDRQIGNTIAKISSKNTADMETARILREVRTGVISYDEAFKTLNKTQSASPEIITKLKSEIDAYEEQRQKVQQNATAQENLGVKVTISGNAAQNAISKVNGNTDAMYENANAANAAANAQSKYMAQLQQQTSKTLAINKLIEKGWSIDRAKGAIEAYFENGKKLSANDLKLVDLNLAANKKLQDSEAALSASKSKTVASSRSSAAAARREAKDREQLAELQYQIAYDYSNREVQLQYDLEKRKDEIRKAYSANPSEMSKYLDYAQKRYDTEKKLYDAQLAYELYGFKLNEQEKLTAEKELNVARIKSSSEYTEEEKKSRIKAVTELYEEELTQIKLAQKQRMLSANEALMTEEQRMIERYKLEREEIEKTASYSPEEKKSILQSSDASFIRGGNGPMDEFFKNSQYKELAKSKLQILKEANLKESEEMEKRYQVALERALKNSEDTLAIDKAYFEARAQMQAEYDKKFSFAKQQDWMSSFQNVSSIVGGVSDSWARLTEAVKNTSGEQSKEYRRMFELQKKFAMVSAVVNGALAVSQVWADPSLNFYMKVGASIATGVATAAEIALIQSQQPQGFEVGGYTGNMGTKQVAGVVHGQEYVLNAEATKRVGVGTLDALNNGASIQSMANGQGASNVNNEINLKNINVFDPGIVGDYLNTPDGAQTMLNFMRKNKTEIQRKIG